jgi:hypothetical protein
MSFISPVPIGLSVGFLQVSGGGDPEATARRRRLSAAMAMQAAEREKRERAKKAGGSEWPRYLSQRSHRSRRHNQAIRGLTRIERDKRLKRFRRVVVRRDVTHLCLNCGTVLNKWRPNQKCCSKACRYALTRWRKQWVAEQIEKDLTEHSKRQKITNVLQQESWRFRGGPSERQRTCKGLEKLLDKSLSIDEFFKKVPQDEARIISAAVVSEETRS